MQHLPLLSLPSPLLICCCPEYHLIRHRAATIKLMRIYNCLNTPRERRSWSEREERGRVLFYLQCKIQIGIENNENVISFPHNTPIHSISHAPSASFSCSSFSCLFALFSLLLKLIFIDLANVEFIILTHYFCVNFELCLPH